MTSGTKQIQLLSDVSSFLKAGRIVTIDAETAKLLIEQKQAVDYAPQEVTVEDEKPVKKFKKEKE